MTAASPQASWIRSLMRWPALFFSKAVPAILIHCRSLEWLGAWRCSFWGECGDSSVLRLRILSAWDCLFISTIVQKVWGKLYFRGRTEYLSKEDHTALLFWLYLVQILTEGGNLCIETGTLGEHERWYGDGTQQTLGVYWIKLGGKIPSMVCLTEFCHL